MRKALALLVLLPMIFAAQTTQSQQKPIINVSGNVWNRVVDVIFFVAGFYGVYYVLSPITGILNNAIVLLSSDITKGVIALLVPLLGSVAIVFAMWFLVYTLLKK